MTAAGPLDLGLMRAWEPLRGARACEAPPTAQTGLPTYGPDALAAARSAELRRQVEADAFALSVQLAPQLAAALWGGSAEERRAAERRRRGAALAKLVQGWLEAPATADEERWPEVARALDEDRLSERKLFP